MQSIRIGFHIFCRNLLINGILILQIIIAFWMLIFTLGTFQYEAYTVRLFRPLRENSLYFSPVSEEEDLSSVFAKLQDVKQVFTIDQYLLINGNERIEIAAYDDALLKLLNYETEGRNLTEDIGLDNGTIPAVLVYETGEVKLGTEFEGSFLYNENSAVIKVVGVLKLPQVLEFAICGGIDCTDLFRYIHSEKRGAALIIVNKNALSGYENCRLATQRGAYIQLNSDEYLEENYAVLQDYGVISIGDKLYADGLVETNKILKSFLPFVFFIGAISLVGIVGLGVLSICNHNRILAVYYMTGCRWKDCCRVAFAYLSIAIVIAAFFNILLWIFLSKTMDWAANGLLVNGWSFVFAAILYGIFLLVAWLTPYLVLKHKTPLDMMDNRMV